MAEYTEKELKELSRVDLRREAVKALGIDNKTASNYRSEELVKMILEKAGGKKGKSEPLPPKGKGKVKEPEPEEPEDDQEQQQEEEKEPPKGRKAESKPASGGCDELLKHVKAIGKGMDENHAALQAQLDEIERKLYVLTGLTIDNYKAVNEPDGIDERIEELDKEWEEKVGDEEGNEE